MAFSTLVSGIGIKCIQYIKPTTFQTKKSNPSIKTDKLCQDSLYQDKKSEDKYC